MEPVIYSRALDIFRRVLYRACDDPDIYAFHGIRVEGYNCSKRANTEELTALHRGWRGGSHKRYDRYDVVEDVIPMLSRTVNSSTPGATPVVREMNRDQVQRLSARPAPVPANLPAEVDETGDETLGGSPMLATPAPEFPAQTGLRIPIPLPGASNYPGQVGRRYPESTPTLLLSTSSGRAVHAPSHLLM